MINLITVGWVYLLLATGTVTAFEHIGNWAILYFTCVALFLIGLNLNSEKYFEFRRVMMVLKYCAPFFIFYSLAAITSSDIGMLFRRIEGGIICTFLVGLTISFCLKKMGEEIFITNFLKVAAVVLFMTIIYKLHSGLLDRDTRFFLNGAIVFSWLMCYSFILTLYSVVKKKISKKYLLLSAVFLEAALWSGSKGPLLALIVTLIKIFYDVGSVNRALKYISFVFALSAILFWILPIFPVHLIERLTDLIGYYNNEGGNRYPGSNGLRTDMWISAWEIFNDNLLVGVGPTNWKEVSVYGEYLYPHNLILELLSETGLIGGLIAITTLIFIWRKTTEVGKLSMLFFMVCASFSGDISYLRMIIGIAIGFAVYREEFLKSKIIMNNSKIKQHQ